ncbi:hypothetical protein HYFRA_00007176 [Hymenoscyphus fraxineus]|uniref:Uncharacterized protein n=1 Tax=Hymenoscyphus fraxineus TaxID=746836 RepID=A0A9N9PTF9_9HELO|nr:hypothetical protein HYFRA_00007176 [Hymenoscyphus fraxineus]
MAATFAPFFFDLELAHFYKTLPTTGGSQHTGRPSNQELINKVMQSNLLGLYRNIRQLSICYKMNNTEIEQFLRGRVPCYPSWDFVSAINLDLNEVTRLYTDAKSPYRYDDAIEQRRYDRVVYESWLRSLSVREHDSLIQGLLKVPSYITRPNGPSIYAEEA